MVTDGGGGGGNGAAMARRQGLCLVGPEAAQWSPCSLFGFCGRVRGCLCTRGVFCCVTGCFYCCLGQ